MANKLYTLSCRVVQFVIKKYMSTIKWRQPIVIKGQKSLLKIPDILEEKGIDNILFMVSRTILRSGALNELMNKMDERKITYTIYNQVSPNPTDIQAEKGFQLYTQNKCKGIVTIGGGSVIDCAKAVGARVVNPNKSMAQLMGMKVKRDIPTLIAVPTTAGTGTEVTMYAVITEERTNHKQGMGDPHLIPHYTILEPELTLSVPQNITAFTGMDALCHAVECYLNDTYMTDELREDARKAVKLIYDNILLAYNDGSNIKARQNMQEGAYLAGKAFNRGMTAYVHAIGHTLGGLYHVPHGKAMGIILPHVLRKYGLAVHSKLAELAEVCGIKGNSVSEKATMFIEWIEETNKKMGMTNKFEEIQEKDIKQMVDWAVKEANPIYPAPVVWDKREVEELIRGLM